MKKIILLICILIGVSSCDMIAEDIQESKIYFANRKYDKERNKIGWELLKGDTEKILWNNMELILPKNTKIKKEPGKPKYETGNLEYNEVVLEIKFVYIPNKNDGNICFAEPTPFKQWYKKKDNDYYFLYADNFENTKSNMVLAEKIVKENGFTECKNGLR